MTRFEKVISAVEKHQVDTIDENSRAIEDFKSELSKWKFEQDDRSDRKHNDLVSQIKKLDADLNKNVYDWRERCDGITSELKVLEL